MNKSPDTTAHTLICTSYIKFSLIILSRNIRQF